MQCCCGEEKKLEDRFSDNDVDLKPLQTVLDKYKNESGSISLT
jgi:iron-sulfur cluster repair protein YtfE (RIC family)